MQPLADVEQQVELHRLDAVEARLVQVDEQGVIAGLLQRGMDGRPHLLEVVLDFLVGEAVEWAVEDSYVHHITPHQNSFRRKTMPAKKFPPPGENIAFLFNHCIVMYTISNGFPLER